MKKIFTFVATMLASASLMAAVYTPAPGENTISALMTSLADGDTIVLSQGDYTEWNTLDFTTKVTFIAAEGDTVNLGIYDLEIQNDFEINGINIHNISVDNYLFRVSAAVAGTIAFKNCTMKVSDETITEPTPYILVSVTGQGTMIIDNCVFMPNTKSQGSVVYGSSKTITNFSMTNSTVYGCPTQSVYCEGITNALVDHCTFYNTAGQILYIKGTLTTCAVKNCIFAANTSITDNCIKTYGGTVDHCIYYNLAAPRSGVTITDCSSADPLFVNPANGDFTLGTGSPALTAGEGGKAIGDPRWVKSGPGTALMQVAAEKNIRKMMVNGQMVIVRDGKAYNVLGF